MNQDIRSAERRLRDLRCVRRAGIALFTTFSDGGLPHAVWVPTALVADLLAEVERLTKVRLERNTAQAVSRALSTEVSELGDALTAMTTWQIKATAERDAALAALVEVERLTAERDKALAAIKRVQALCDNATAGPLYERAVRAALAGNGNE